MSIGEGEKEEGTSASFDVVLVLESVVFGEDNSGERGHVYWVMGIVWVTFKNDVMRVSKSVALIIGCE